MQVGRRVRTGEAIGQADLRLVHLGDASPGDLAGGVQLRAAGIDHQSPLDHAVGQLLIVEHGFDARPKIIDARIHRLELEREILDGRHARRVVGASELVHAIGSGQFGGRRLAGVGRRGDFDFAPADIAPRARRPGFRQSHALGAQQVLAAANPVVLRINHQLQRIGRVERIPLPQRRAVPSDQPVEPRELPLELQVILPQCADRLEGVARPPQMLGKDVRVRRVLHFVEPFARPQVEHHVRLVASAERFLGGFELAIEPELTLSAVADLGDDGAGERRLFLAFDFIDEPLEERHLSAEILRVLFDGLFERGQTAGRIIAADRFDARAPVGHFVDGRADLVVAAAVANEGPQAAANALRLLRDGQLVERADLLGRRIERYFSFGKDKLADGRRRDQFVPHVNLHADSRLPLGEGLRRSPRRDIKKCRRPGRRRRRDHGRPAFARRPCPWGRGPRCPPA